MAVVVEDVTLGGRAAGALKLLTEAAGVVEVAGEDGDVMRLADNVVRVGLPAPANVTGVEWGTVDAADGMADFDTTDDERCGACGPVADADAEDRAADEVEELFPEVSA